VPPTIHRCDLVRLWGKVRGVTPCPRTTLATEGVRHSLQVIFQTSRPVGAVPTTSCWIRRGRKVREGAS
jgi:hypothetical protein